MLRPLSMIRLAMYLVTGIMSVPSIEAEEENTGALQIESVTNDLSADLHIAREEGEKPPRSEADDRKRTKLGIGETVKLFVTGKDTLIGNKQKNQMDYSGREKPGKIRKGFWKQCISQSQSLLGQRGKTHRTGNDGT